LSYIGQRPVVGRYIKLDQISSGFNGSETSFSMTAGSQAVFPGTARNLLLSLGGVIQEPDTNFTISGSTLTFTTAPVANTTFFAVIFGDMQSTGTPSDGTVLPASIASSGNFSFPQLTVTGTSSLGDDVTFTGANYNVVWDKSADALEFPDGAKAVFGTGSDVEIYHDGTNSRIHSSSHNLYIRTGGIFGVFNGAGSETMLKATVDGAVELYHDNSKRLETTSTGIALTGNLELGDNERIVLGDAGTSDSHIRWDASHLQIASAGLARFSCSGLSVVNLAGTETQLTTTENGSVELYFDNSKKFNTRVNGIQVQGVIIFDDDTNTYIEHGSSGDEIQLVTGSNTRLLVDGHVKNPNDNSYIFVGASNDLGLVHDGTDSKILNQTGELKILANNVQFKTKLDDETLADFNANGAVELYYDNSKQLETTANGTQFAGRINFTGTGQKIDLIDNQQIRIGTGDDLIIEHDATNSRISNTTGQLQIRSDTIALENAAGNSYATLTGISFADNGKARFGNNDDLQIYHDGSGTYLDNYTGNIEIRGNEFRAKSLSGSNEAMIQASYNGDVNLWYDNSKKFETTANGAEITGRLDITGGYVSLDDNYAVLMGTGGDAQLYHSGTHQYLLNTTGNIYIQPKASETGILIVKNGATELYYDNNKKFETSSTGNLSTGVHKFITGSGSTSSDDNVVHIVAGATASRGMMLGTGRAGGSQQNDGMGFIDAINSESNGYGSQLQFRIDGTAVMSIGNQSNDFVGIGTTTPSSLLHVDTGTASESIKLNSDEVACFLSTSNTGDTHGRQIIMNATRADSGSLPHLRLGGQGGIILAVDTNTTRMSIDTSGNIGAPTGTNIYNASDERVKKNVTTLDKGLEAIKSLRPVSFNWIDGFCDAEKDTLYGFVAQEVQTIDPNLVAPFGNDVKIGDDLENPDQVITDPLRVNEKFIIPMLVKAVQELSAKVAALEAA